MRVVLVGLLLGLLFAAPANATQRIWAATFNYGDQQRTWLSLTPPPTGPITVYDADCPWQSGVACTTESQGRKVWVSRQLFRDEWQAAVFHELGHQFDYEHPELRRPFLALLALGDEWRTPADSPHEQFAEAYRLCAVYATRPQREAMGYGFVPSRRQFDAVCRLMRSS